MATTDWDSSCRNQTRRIASARDHIATSGRTHMSQNHSPQSTTGSDSENPAISAPTPKPRTESRAPLTNQDWWPDQSDVAKLPPHVPAANPLGEGYDYAKEIAPLDV